jgi:prepilin-type N-terminal cleavage/methylation domain-containing protein
VRNGFSLVEVVISVLIISVIGIALLQMNSNTIRSIQLFENRLKVDEYSSPIFLNIDSELHNKSQTVYEFVKSKYGTVNDTDLIEYLDKKELLYQQRELYFLHFGEDGELSMDSMNDSESGREVTSEVQKEGVLIEEVSIKDENNNSTSLYHFSFSSGEEEGKKR